MWYVPYRRLAYPALGQAMDTVTGSFLMTSNFFGGTRRKLRNCAHWRMVTGPIGTTVLARTPSSLVVLRSSEQQFRRAFYQAENMLWVQRSQHIVSGGERNSWITEITYTAYGTFRTMYIGFQVAWNPLCCPLR